MKAHTTITHDRYMLEKICDKLLVFEEKRIQRVRLGRLPEAR